MSLRYNHRSKVSVISPKKNNRREIYNAGFTDHTLDYDETGDRNMVVRRVSGLQRPRVPSFGFSTKVLEEKISTLPLEICRIIMEALFEDIFGPRNVHPQKNGLGTSSFLILNAHLYRKYSRVYWSQNTWVVGSGPAEDAMRFMVLPPYHEPITEFSKQKPNEAALRIKRVEISFSKEDLRPQIVEEEGIKRDGLMDRTCLLDGVRTTPEHLTACLLQIWQDKFDRVAFLDLDYLVLDYRGAYSPSGAFLGLTAVHRFMRFYHRVPKNFKVMAPTRLLEDEIRNVFVELNRPPVKSLQSSQADGGNDCDA